MTPPAPGRRAQNRANRHEQILTASAAIVTEVGVEDLTMQAVAERVGCAVGTIYTYFNSKSALVVSLQIEAIDTLIETFEASAKAWDDEFTEVQLEQHLAALARLVCFGRLFVAARHVHPREFELLQILISTRRPVTTNEDLESTMPHTIELISTFVNLLDRAVELGVINKGHDEVHDSSVNRTVRWAGSMNGVLLVANVTSDPDLRSALGVTHAEHQSRILAQDLLKAWGADPELLQRAVTVADQMVEHNRLVVVP